MSDSSNFFSDLSEELQASIRDLGWTEPTPVQAKTLPLLRAGGDLIVQAITGSGKTGAFGIPIIEQADPDSTDIQALILLPTRELANQVAVEVGALGKHRGVRCLPIYGGVGYGPQIEGLERGAHVVAGTPGRILDHLGNGRMDVSKLRVLVFDEADEMLSLGFWPDMREIASYLPEDRQSHLFSATIPEKVRSLSRYFLKDPEFVTLSDGQVAPQEIEHSYYVCAASEKESVLARLLEIEDPESAIIFCNTKADVRYITGYLQKRKHNADQISGDLTQAAREQAIKRIKSGQLRYLVATDVAARGIDISDLSHVISYTSPDAPEVYVHRTGRTGRAGKSGVAISLVSGLDIGNFRHLMNVNKIEINERPVPTEADMLKRIGERLQVKVEHEMRSISAEEVELQVDRLVPVVEQLAKSIDGRRDLAAVCAAYLAEHRPETNVPDTAAIDANAEASDEDADRANRKPSRPRQGRGGRPRGGGGRGGGRGRR